MGATGEEMRSRWLEYFDDFLSLREDKETKPRLNGERFINK